MNKRRGERKMKEKQNQRLLIYVIVAFALVLALLVITRVQKQGKEEKHHESNVIYYVDQLEEKGTKKAKEKERELKYVEIAPKKKEQEKKELEKKPQVIEQQERAPKGVGKEQKRYKEEEPQEKEYEKKEENKHKVDSWEEIEVKKEGYPRYTLEEKSRGRGLIVIPWSKEYQSLAKKALKRESVTKIPYLYLNTIEEEYQIEIEPEWESYYDDNNGTVRIRLGIDDIEKAYRYTERGGLVGKSADLEYLEQLSTEGIEAYAEDSPDTRKKEYVEGVGYTEEATEAEKEKVTEEEEGWVPNEVPLTELRKKKK